MWSGQLDDVTPPLLERASHTGASATLTIDVFIVGGGRSRLEVEGHDLDDLSDQLRRERSLVGRLLSLNEEEVEGHVLIPAHRVALILQS